MTRGLSPLISFPFSILGPVAKSPYFSQLLSSIAFYNHLIHLSWVAAAPIGEAEAAQLLLQDQLSRADLQLPLG